MLIWICGPIILLKVEWFPLQGYVNLHNAIDEGMLASSPHCWTVHVGET